MNLHHHFDQFSDSEKGVIGQAYNALHRVLMEHNINLRIAGDDTAERVVDAIAKGILDTRVITAELHRQAARERLKGLEMLDKRKSRASIVSCSPTPNCSPN